MITITSKSTKSDIEQVKEKLYQMFITSSIGVLPNYARYSKKEVAEKHLAIFSKWKKNLHSFEHLPTDLNLSILTEMILEEDNIDLATRTDLGFEPATNDYTILKDLKEKSLQEIEATKAGEALNKLLYDQFDNYLVLMLETNDYAKTEEDEMAIREYLAYGGELTKEKYYNYCIVKYNFSQDRDKVLGFLDSTFGRTTKMKLLEAFLEDEPVYGEQN